MSKIITKTSEQTMKENAKRKSESTCPACMFGITVIEPKFFKKDITYTKYNCTCGTEFEVR